MKKMALMKLQSNFQETGLHSIQKYRFKNFSNQINASNGIDPISQRSGMNNETSNVEYFAEASFVN